MSFCPRTPKWESWNSQNWDSRDFGGSYLCVDVRLKWGPKQSCGPHWKLSNRLWHTTCKQGNQGNLIPNPSFGHNLCLKYPNGSCKPILNILFPKAFQLYKKLLNPMGFDPCNCFLNIRESIETPTPKVGAHLGVWRFIPSRSPTLLKAWNVTSKLHFWPTPLQALALVVNPRLELWQIGCALGNRSIITK
jgi:hypothetical protein